MSEVTYVDTRCQLLITTSITTFMRFFHCASDLLAPRDTQPIDLIPPNPPTYNYK